jgi:hypothetical protein
LALKRKSFLTEKLLKASVTSSQVRRKTFVFAAIIVALRIAVAPEQNKNKRIFPPIFSKVKLTFSLIQFVKLKYFKPLKISQNNLGKTICKPE